MIGVPRYWRSTTLPAGHVWANGDLALFADWPELKKIYDAGGFAGMLLAYNANSATIAANLGKWRPNAANPTGLYVPNLSEQFFRAWTGTGEAGSSVTDTGRVATGDLGFHAYSASGATGIFAVSGSGAAANLWVNNGTFGYPKISMDLTGAYGVEHAGTEFAPIHIHIPVVLYLGNSV